MSVRSARPSWLRNTVATGMLAVAGAGVLAAAPAALATYPGDNGKIAFARDGDIWTIEADGSGERRITSGPHQDSSPEWSRDGGELLFQREAIAPASGSHIYRMRADGTGLTWVREGTDPQYSPKGIRIAFGGPGDAVWVADADGKNARKLAEAGGNPITVDDWAPSHSLLLYTVHDNDSIFVAQSPEGIATGFGVLHDDERHEDNTEPSWSPDGTRLAFVTQYSGITCEHEPVPGDAKCPTGLLGINTMDLGAGDRRRVSRPGRQPVYSPDAALLAFVVDGVIHTSGADGAGARALTLGEDPDWQAIPGRPQGPPPPERVVTVPGPTVTVTVPGPTVTVPAPPRVPRGAPRTDAGEDACFVPEDRRRFTLTLRAGRTIRLGQAIRVRVDLAAEGPRATVLNGKRLRARATIR